MNAYGEGQINVNINTNVGPVEFDPSGIEDMIDDVVNAEMADTREDQPSPAVPAGTPPGEQPPQAPPPQPAITPPPQPQTPSAAINIDELTTRWEDLNILRKTLGKAEKGDLEALRSLYDDTETRDYAHDVKGGIKAVDAEISDIMKALGITPPGGGEDEESKTDRTAQKHADAIGQMALRHGAGAMQSLFGIPGIGALAGAVGGAGVIGGIIAAAGMGIGQVVDWGNESIDLDKQLAIAHARNPAATVAGIRADVGYDITAAGGKSLGIDAVQRAARANAISVATGIPLHDAIAIVDAEQIATLGYGLTPESARALLELPGGTTGGGDIAGYVQSIRDAGLGDLASGIVGQGAGITGMIQKRTLQAAGDTGTQGAIGFAAAMGAEFGAVGLSQSAELFGTFAQMASSAGSDRKQAFLARIFASRESWNVTGGDGQPIGRKKDPQSFMDWQVRYLSTPEGLAEIAAFAQAEFGDIWRLALVEMGLAPDTIRAGMLGKSLDIDSDDMSDIKARAEAQAEIAETASGKISIYGAEKATEKQIADVTYPSEVAARFSHLAATAAIGSTTADLLAFLPPDTTNWAEEARLQGVTIDLSPQAQNAPPVNTAGMNWAQKLFWTMFPPLPGAPQQTPEVTVTNGTTDTGANRTVLDIIVRKDGGAGASGPATVGSPRTGGTRTGYAQ